MDRRITYYFSLLSPWAYVGHAVFMDIARRHGAEVAFRPVNLIDVFSETGGLPLPKRHPARQRYRMLELQRWRDRRRLCFNLHPRFWPFDARRADNLVVAAVATGRDPAVFVHAAHVAVWEQDRDLADEHTLRDIAANLYSDPDLLFEFASTSETAQAYARNTSEAIAADAFGSPVYVLGGEVFWGQDRLDLLDDALTTGRQPFSANA